jgi:hypothetical protein
LIQQLTAPDPKDRYTVHQVLVHPWICGETATDTVIADSDKRLDQHNSWRQVRLIYVFDHVPWQTVQTFTVVSSRTETARKIARTHHQSFHAQLFE